MTSGAARNGMLNNRSLSVAYLGMQKIGRSLTHNVFAQTVDIRIWFLCRLLFLVFRVFTLCFILYVCSVMCAASVT